MENTEYKNFTETDFDLIKDSLKTHLKSQEIFKDYNFEGSAINTLLNILAYNTQYNAYYLNMLASEKFLARAQKRKSIVELANNLGYVPRSAKSSISKVSFEIVQDAGYTNNIFLPKNLKFSTAVSGTSYQFLTTSDTIVEYNPLTQKYVVTDLEIKEGRFFKHKFVVNGTSKFFKIPNANVDLSRLVVKVKPTEFASDNSAIEFLPYGSVLDVNGSSPIYYVQETDNQKHEIYFGDGILGRQLEVGNQVIIEYYVTSGSEANGANVFNLDDDVTGLDRIINLTAERASNGYSIESTDSIKLSAKNYYLSQNRTVVEADYIQIVKNIFPEVSDVSVWGGERATPKQYGKVFISVIKENLTNLTSSEKKTGLGVLNRNFTILGITPEFVDAEIINLELTTNVRVSPAYNKAPSEMRALVMNTVVDSLTPIINKFGAQVYESRVEEVINDADRNILSNTTRFRLYYSLENKILDNSINMIRYPVSVMEGLVVSSDFTFRGIQNCKLQDDGLGSISIVTNNSIIQPNVMSINYLTSTIKVSSPAVIDEILDENLTVRLYVTPKDTDIILDGSAITRLNQSDIIVNIN